MTNFKTFIKKFVEKTKNVILELEKFSTLTNEDKKETLDEQITLWTDEAINSLPVNPFCKWMLKKFVLPNVANFTQTIFDLLKAKVEGFTKEVENG